VTQMLVRDLAPEVVERLKERARSNGRSLQKEVRAILGGGGDLYDGGGQGGHREVAGAFRGTKVQ